MEKKKRKKWPWIAGVIVFLVIVGALGSDGDKKETAEDPAGSGVTQSDSESAAQSEETKKQYSASGESLAQLFTDTFKFEYENLSVEYDDEFDNYMVSYYPTGSISNESSFVRDAVSNYINYSDKALAVEGVPGVEFLVHTKMRDEYGNENLDHVMTIGMKKEAFEKFNWSNLEHQSIYDTFAKECEFFWIHPGILKNVDRDKVYYKP